VRTPNAYASENPSALTTPTFRSNRRPATYGPESFLVAVTHRAPMQICTRVPHGTWNVATLRSASWSWEPSQPFLGPELSREYADATAKLNGAGFRFCALG
jgi:hypothetical protein